VRWAVRAPAEQEIHELAAIHAASRTVFPHRHRQVIARLPLVDTDVLRTARDRGLLVIATGPDGPIGFGLLREGGAGIHLEQLSLRPDLSGRGIGGKILTALVDRSIAAGRMPMTLITFDDIPWNMPFYIRHGFSKIPQAALPEHVRDCLSVERALGIGPEHRIAMWKGTKREGCGEHRGEDRVGIS
jgi:GNAT superfamily N-acetyltransferase